MGGAGGDLRRDASSSGVIAHFLEACAVRIRTHARRVPGVARRYLIHLFRDLNSPPVDIPLIVCRPNKDDHIQDHQCGDGFYIKHRLGLVQLLLPEVPIQRRREGLEFLCQRTVHVPEGGFGAKPRADPKQSPEKKVEEAAIDRVFDAVINHRYGLLPEKIKKRRAERDRDHVDREVLFNMLNDRIQGEIPLKDSSTAKCYHASLNSCNHDMVLAYFGL